MLWGTFCWHVTLRYTCHLRWKHNCKSLQTNADWSPFYSMKKHFYPDWSCFFHDENALTHRAQGLAEFYDEHENDLNHKLWPLQSLVHLWNILGQNVRQCSPSPLIQWQFREQKNNVHPSNTVLVAFFLLFLIVHFIMVFLCTLISYITIYMFYKCKNLFIIFILFYFVIRLIYTNI